MNPINNRSYKERWLISGAYLAMLLPCVIFFIISSRLFKQPHVVSLGISTTTYVLGVIAMTKGLSKYYSDPSKETDLSLAGFRTSIKMIWPLVTASISLGVPALVFAALSLRQIGRSRLLLVIYISAGLFFSVMYFLRVSRLSSLLSQNKP